MASFWEIQRVESTGDLLDDMNTYVSQPNVPGRLPAVIVAQEAFGVTGHIQNVADRLSDAGYIAVAPALFHREGTTEGVRGTNPMYGYSDEDRESATKAMGNLRDEQMILDINTTIAWLQRHPRVLGDKIGIVGFCMGGRVVYLAAAACPGLSAGVSFYGGNILKDWGGPPTPFDRTANIQCPIMGNFGEQDQNPTVDDVRNIEAELQKHGKTYDFKMYPATGHGFYCDERESYHEASAKDAWARALDWFQKHLAAVTATA